METVDRPKLSAARIAVGYASVATLWISFSDLVIFRLNLSPALSTAKGIGFVTVTALLLYFTIKRLVNDVQRTTRERDETAKLYQTVVEASEQGICLLDEFGKIEFSNQRMSTLLSVPAEKLKGSYIQDYVVGSAWSLQCASGARDPHTHEHEFVTESGRRVHVLVSCTPLVKGGVNLSGSLAMFLDISDRKRLELELRQSQKLEALGSFAGGITHDFNNLLSIITGYASLLENALPVKSQERNAASEILGACQRGSLLVRQLLAFSRRQSLVPDVVDVSESVSRFGEVLPRMVGEHIDVSIECEHPGSSVRIGAGQIEQILMNCAANARDAMRRGGTLTIRTSLTEINETVAAAEAVESGWFVVLQVIDTGTGIAPEYKNRIFEPFFTTKPQGSGTGLGLATVYGIVKQNGGFVTCDSTLGVGTIFTVYLPRTRLAQVQTRSVASPQVLVGKEKILLVEDEPALRAITKHMLSKHGYVVVDAPNGTEALNIIESGERDLDLVLTDIMMPQMNGVELANELSRLIPKTPIVFMSGHSDFPVELNGTAHIIQKPITPYALLCELRRLLDDHASKRRSSAQAYRA